MSEAVLDEVIRVAERAPSVHNTRPWRFDVAGDRVDVLADRDRQLAFLDPSGRQLHVSCGAAVEFAYLTARARGRACDVTLLPDPAQRDLVARLALGDEQPPTDEEARLAAAIAGRHVDRGPYRDQPLPPELVADMRRRAEDLGAWVRQLDEADDRRSLIAVLTAAEQAEAAEPAYAEELRQWTAREPGERGLPPGSAPAWPADRVPDVPLRDFTGAAQHPRPGGGEAAPPTVERDTLVLVETHDDEPGSWLRAGRAVGWILLRAAADGVSAQPLGPAIDLPAGRERLRRELRLAGHPQFVLRLGYPQPAGSAG